MRVRQSKSARRWRGAGSHQVYDGPAASAGPTKGGLFSDEERVIEFSRLPEPSGWHWTAGGKMFKKCETGWIGAEPAGPRLREREKSLAIGVHENIESISLVRFIVAHLVLKAVLLPMPG